MKILIKHENDNDWHYHLTEFVEFEPQNEITRRRDQFYSTLKFKVTFPASILKGTYTIAYALPYVYSDLVQDLDYARKLLLS